MASHKVWQQLFMSTLMTSQKTLEDFDLNDAISFEYEKKNTGDLVVTIQQWNGKYIEAKFVDAIRVSDILGGELMSFRQVAVSNFLDMALETNYENLPPSEHPYKHYQFVGIDDDIVLEIICTQVIVCVAEHLAPTLNDMAKEIVELNELSTRLWLQYKDDVSSCVFDEFFKNTDYHYLASCFAGFSSQINAWGEIRHGFDTLDAFSNYKYLCSADYVKYFNGREGGDLLLACIAVEQRLLELCVEFYEIQKIES